MNNRNKEAGTNKELPQEEINIDKLNKKLSEKNKELETVVYVTSHDIRSPLVNILGFTDEMAKALNKLVVKIFDEKNVINNKEEIESITKKDIPQIQNFIKQSGEKIERLLLALIKLSRLGRAEVAKTEADMNEIVHNVLNEFQGIINNENIKIDINHLQSCYTDIDIIKQVFTYLVDNAVKYRNRQKEPEISITSVQENNHITYCIKDNGIGIPELAIDKIFDIFYRVDPDNGQGEGIGLTLVKKAMEKLEGKIVVKSVQENQAENRNGETCIYITLEKQKA